MDLKEFIQSNQTFYNIILLVFLARQLELCFDFLTPLHDFPDILCILSSFDDILLPLLCKIFKKLNIKP